MAKLNDKSLSRPPFNLPVVKNGGYMDIQWQQWFERMYVRIGSASAQSNSELQENSTYNSNDIESLKENININIENIKKVDEKASKNSEDITSLKQQQNIDHQSILANTESINLLKEKNVNIEENIDTIEESVNNINNSITNINQKLNKFEVFDTLPSNVSFANKIIYYSNVGSMCYSLDGFSWRKIKDDTQVS